MKISDIIPNKKIIFDRKYIIYGLISVVAVYYKYGMYTALVYPFVLYAMFMSIFIIVEIYLIAKDKFLGINGFVSKPKFIRLVTSMVFLIISFCIIPYNMKIVSSTFALLVLSILSIIELVNILLKK